MYRAVLVVLDVFAILLGLVWTGQGIGIIKGSFMTGSAFWLVVGLVLLVLGGGHLALLAVKGRRP
ncbi:MAG: hypothetical protein ABR573_08680 [Candidatus Dormibacteria bacterium]